MRLTAKNAGMEKGIKDRVKKALDTYLEANNLRKTPERYAVLNAIYNTKGHLSLDDLEVRVEKEYFRVSRATLYNTIRLFMKLGLVVRHRFSSGTLYEARKDNDNHCHQVCTICGKITEVHLPEVAQMFEEIKLKRFHKNGYIFYIHGICTTCRIKQSRLKNDKKRKKQEK